MCRGEPREHGGLSQKPQQPEDQKPEGWLPESATGSRVPLGSLRPVKSPFGNKSEVRRFRKTEAEGILASWKFSARRNEAHI